MAFRITIIVFILAAATAVSLLYFYYPASINPYPGCILFVLTGIFCPACGGQRAFSALTEGDLVSALQHNMLFLLFLILAAGIFFRFVIHTLQQRKQPFRIRFTSLQLWIMLGVILAFWIIRNIFPVLHP